MKRNLLFVSLMTLILIAGTVSPALAQDRMTYEEYMADLERWAQREQAALDKIAKLEADIAALQSDIDALDQAVAQTWQEIYDMLKLTDAELQMFAAELDALGAEIEMFGTLSPEEIYQRRAELEELGNRLDGLAGHRAALLSEYKAIIDRLYAQLESINARMAKPQVKVYTVVRGDYLWKISGMDEHYGDGAKWMRIYSVNHDQIDDPDLIFPDQQFNIPMDIDDNAQYLVGQGDHLYGIAERVFSDPFKWRELYEANKELIEDPNYIVPEMILDLPER
jgi:nucleoid-associated protein YgaU